MKSVHLSIYVSPAAHAALVSRAETASRTAGVPIKPTSLAAAMLHGALGLRPDGRPAGDAAAPVRQPLATEQEQDEGTPEALRARAVEYASGLYDAAALVGPPSRGRGVVEGWANALAARFPSLGADVVRGILAEAGVPRVLLDTPAPVPPDVAVALQKAVAALPSLASTKSAERRKERIWREWIPMLKQKTGATDEQVVDALKAKPNRRRLSLRYADLDLESTKPGLVAYNAKQKRKKPG